MIAQLELAPRVDLDRIDPAHEHAIESTGQCGDEAVRHPQAVAHDAEVPHALGVRDRRRIGVEERDHAHLLADLVRVDADVTRSRSPGHIQVLHLPLRQDDGLAHQDAVIRGDPQDDAVRRGQDFFKDYWGKVELSTFDASFVKLREVTLGYTFTNVPALQRVGIRSLNLSLLGRNLWIIHKNTPDIDPEIGMGAGNYVGMETNAIPSVRPMGFNPMVNF